MGFFDAVKSKLTGENNNVSSYDDGFYGDADDIYGVPSYDEETEGAETETDDVYAPASAGVSMSTGMSINGSAIELKVVKPDRFENVSQIADHLLNKRTVVLNLESTNKETARRLIDFLSGVAYSIDGQLKRVANNAYVITPNNVDVGDAQLKNPKVREEEPVEEPNTDIFPEF